MFCEKACSYTCYSGDCGLCHGCCGGVKNITQGYKFPIYTVDTEKQYSEQEKKRLKIKKQFRELYVEDKMQGLPAVTQLSDSCISSQ